MRRLRRTLLTAAAVAVAATAAVALAAAPASADSSECTRSGCAGKAVFVPLGEHLKVTDRTGDGHSAVALYWLEGGTGPYLVWNHGGKGTTVDRNLDLPEGSWIYYQICLGEYGKRKVLTSTCSTGRTDWA